MALSYATLQADKIELTPCIVSLGGTQIGGTTGNVTIAWKFDKSPIKVDQLGTTVLNNKISGIDITVTTEFAEFNDKTKWNLIFPHLDITGTDPANVIDMVSKVGADDLSVAAELKLHPMSTGPADANFEHTFFKAIATEESQIVFSPTEQVKMKVVWRILPDTSVTPYKFWRFGDTTI